MKTNKKRLATYLKLGILLFGISVLLWNCEKDEIINEDHNHVKHQPKNVSIEEIPEIANVLFKNGKSTQGRTTYLSCGNVDLDDILQLIDEEEGVTNYSFRFTHENNNENVFYNYIVTDKGEGNYSESIIKYVPDETFLNNYSIFNPVDIAHFSGNIKVYSYVSFCSSNSKQSKTSSDSCPPNDIVINPGGGLDNSGGGSNGTIDGSGPSQDGGGSFCTTSYSIGTTCRYRRYHPANVCVDDGWFGIFTIRCHTYSKTSNTSDCPKLTGSFSINLSTLFKELQMALQLSTDQQNWLMDEDNLEVAGQIYGFLESNKDANGDYTLEAKNFAKEALALEIILSKNLEVVTTGKHPDEINFCCPGSCCPNQSIYGDDKIIQEYGVKPIQSSIDATFNIIVGIATLVGSKNWVGERVRLIMNDIGMEVPVDISNEHLGEFYQIRKKDGQLIVEQREGFLVSMIKFGVDSLDLLAFLSPIKGGGTFLAIKTNGFTIASLKKLFKHVSDTILSSQRIISGNTTRGVQSLNKKVSRGDLPYQGISVNQEQVEKIIKEVMLSKNRLDQVTRNQQGVEVLDIFDTVTQRGVRLIKSTNEFDTFINY